MYQQFFGLDKNPFSITPDPNFLYMTPRHREALAALVFAISCRKGFMVLTGDAGTGKTTLLRTVLKRVSNSRTIFSFVVHPTLTPSEFLEYTLADFGLTNIPTSKARKLVLFHQFLLQCHADGKSPVLVVDEAQKLSPELLEEIRLLTNSETAEHKLLQIILAGQNELSAVLAREDMRQLRQRIAVRMNIGALTASEVLPYLQTRWMRAGASAPFPFAPGAVNTIASVSQGIPRLINLVADAALVSAFGTGTKTVLADHIKAVAADLQLGPGITSSLPSPDTGVALDKGLPKPTAFIPVLPDIERAPLKTFQRYMPSESKRPALLRFAALFGLA